MELFFVLLIPLILAAVAVTGTVKGVDVYEGLSTGALDGLRILVRILPPLVGLMTAVYMLRGLRLLDLAGQGPCAGASLPGDSAGDHRPASYPPHQRQRRPGSGVRAHSELRSRFFDWPHSGGDDGQHRDYLLHSGGVFRSQAGVRNTRYAIPAALCADLLGLSPPAGLPGSFLVPSGRCQGSGAVVK